MVLSLWSDSSINSSKARITLLQQHVQKDTVLPDVGSTFPVSAEVHVNRRLVEQRRGVVFCF